jgi:hypothetical protein
VPVPGFPVLVRRSAVPAAPLLRAAVPKSLPRAARDARRDGSVKSSTRETEETPNRRALTRMKMSYHRAQTLVHADHAKGDKLMKCFSINDCKPPAKWRSQSALDDAASARASNSASRLCNRNVASATRWAGCALLPFFRVIHGVKTRRSGTFSPQWALDPEQASGAPKGPRRAARDANEARGSAENYPVACRRGRVPRSAPLAPMSASNAHE